MRIKKRKIAVSMIILMVILIGIRIALPYGIKWYLNNRVLNNLDAYTGRVEDVDLRLFRGAYTIDQFVIEKIDTEVTEPFINIPRMDLSIQWEALFEGEIVGEIVCYQPVLHFSFNPEEDESQTGEGEDWTAVVKDLIPIRINRFAVKNGKVALTNVLTEPNTDLPLEKFNLEIKNIQNTLEADADSLPSRIIATGDAPGYGGTLDFKADAMLLKEFPDLDYDLKFENVTLESLNPLAEHFIGLDFEEGDISIYSEMIIKDQSFEGYVKPLVKDMKIFEWKEEDRPLGQWFKEFFGEGVKEVFENQKKEQFATRVPIEGNVDEVKTDIWTSIGVALRNAYIEALKYELDESIGLEDKE